MHIEAIGGCEWRRGNKGDKKIEMKDKEKETKRKGNMVPGRDLVEKMNIQLGKAQGINQAPRIGQKTDRHRRKILQ